MSRMLIENMKASSDDLALLCHVGLRYGNNTRKILSSMQCKASRDRLISLIDKLGIQDTAVGDSSVTFSAVMAGFPEVTLRILHKNNPPMLILHDELKAINMDYPAVARSPIAASVIPFNLKADFPLALAAIVVPALKMAEILRASDPRWVRWSYDRRQRAADILIQVKNRYRKFLLSVEQRLILSIELGVVEEKEGVQRLTAAWRAAGTAAIAWLQSEYHYDVIMACMWEL